MYGFRKDSYPTLKDAAAEAVQRIYGAGLMFRDGKLMAGGNNMMANKAAEAFGSFDLAALKHSTNPIENAFAQIIRLRQDYMNGKGGNPDQSLQQIYDAAQVLKSHGFKMRDEPHALGGSPVMVPPLSPAMQAAMRNRGPTI